MDKKDALCRRAAVTERLLTSQVNRSHFDLSFPLTLSSLPLVAYATGVVGGNLED